MVLWIRASSATRVRATVTPLLTAAELPACSRCAATASPIPARAAMTPISALETGAPRRAYPKILWWPLRPSAATASSHNRKPATTATPGEGTGAHRGARWNRRTPILSVAMVSQLPPSSATRPMRIAPVPAQSLRCRLYPYVVTASSPLRRNVTMPIEGTEMAALQAVFWSAAPVAMASSSRPSMKSASLASIIRASPTTAIPRPAASSVEPAAMAPSNQGRSVIWESKTP